MSAEEPQRFPTLSYAEVRRRLLAREEVALIDVREEDPYAQEHPLWASNFPLSRIELEASRRIPRRDTALVLYGDFEGQDLAPRAAQVFRALGYEALHLLEGGLEGWKQAGGEVFRDVNVPSKAFGELVEHERGTPSLPAQEVQALISGGADVVIVDARRFDEYQTMSIPSATSLPGAELVLRVRELAPNPETQVIVNCAGRTRSIIGTQSLINAGLPNPIAALRNGTIGWLLAGQTLDHGAAKQAPEPSPAHLGDAQAGAQEIARRAGVRQIRYSAAQTLEEAGRTLYRLDVRTPAEFEAGHLPGFLSAPGGQLVQETDHHVPVRGARILLDDADGVRAYMTASWLAQMGWETYVLTSVPASLRILSGPDRETLPLPAVSTLTALELSHLLKDEAAGSGVQVLDLSAGRAYGAGHVPGAWFAIRAQLEHALEQVPQAALYVLTSPDGILAQLAAPELEALVGASALVQVLEGGNAAWQAAGLPLEAGARHLAVPQTDRYRRPYEGTDAPREAMQAYLDWEFGLIAQLERDGTHHFQVA